MIRYYIRAVAPTVYDFSIEAEDEEALKKAMTRMMKYAGAEDRFKLQMRRRGDTSPTIQVKKMVWTIEDEEEA